MWKSEKSFVILQKEHLFWGQRIPVYLAKSCIYLQVFPASLASGVRQSVSSILWISLKSWIVSAKILWSMTTQEKALKEIVPIDSPWRTSRDVLTIFALTFSDQQLYSCINILQFDLVE